MIGAFRRWSRRHKGVVAQATAFSVAILATFIAVQALRYTALLRDAEQFIADWEVAALSPQAKTDQDIAVVAIKESTLDQFPYREPVDRGFLAKLITTLEARHVRGIAMDILLDQPSETEKDAALRAAIRNAKIPLVIAYTQDPQIVPPERLAFLQDFVPQADRGIATLVTDHRDVVRAIYPGKTLADGKWQPGFSAALAAKLGAPVLDHELAMVWHGQPGGDGEAFTEFPAETALIMPPAFFNFANKVVLIGADVSLNDRHRTPFYVLNQKPMAGVIIQANALWQILNGKQPPAAAFLVNLLIIFLCAGMGAELGALNIAVAARIAYGSLFVLSLWIAGAALYHFGGSQIQLVAPSLAMAVSLWATESLTGREARKERAFIHGAFSRYVAPKVVEQLVQNPEKMALDGERRELTILFSDIEGFTTLSEKMDSRELARVLNAYLDGATEQVLKFDGMVDKFIGDAVMAIFNAPVDLPMHAEAAVHCMLAMDEFCERFRHAQNADGIKFGRTRIGAHTGVAVIGNFGSHQRFSYTAQGDTVNTASRLEGLNKHFDTRLCVSGATKALCPSVPFRPMGEITLKGKTEPIAVWEPMPANDPRTGYLERYTLAYEALAAGDPAAARLFEELAKAWPGDPLIHLHMSRLSEGEAGVLIVMHEK